MDKSSIAINGLQHIGIPVTNLSVSGAFYARHELLAGIRSRKDGHVDHVAFDVSDVDETFKWVKANGFRIVESQPVFLAFWKNGCKYFNVTGPDGERLEFNQIL